MQVMGSAGTLGALAYSGGAGAGCLPQLAAGGQHVFHMRADIWLCQAQLTNASCSSVTKTNPLFQLACFLKQLCLVLMKDESWSLETITQL